MSLRQRLLEGYHEQVGHPGITRMYMQLRERYFWYRMKLDVTRHCETCQVCQITKARVTKAPLIQHQLSYLSQRVFLDAKGPLILTERGNVYYLILVDGWSKWCGCYQRCMAAWSLGTSKPIPSTTANPSTTAFKLILYDSYAF